MRLLNIVRACVDERQISGEWLKDVGDEYQFAKPATPDA